MADDSSERRQFLRYPTHIEAYIRRRGLSNVFRSQSVEMVDFSRYGCGCDADGEFEIGDILLVTASLGGASVTNIPGVVRSIRKNGDLVHLGIQFQMENISEKAQEALHKMEMVIKRQ